MGVPISPPGREFNVEGASPGMVGGIDVYKNPSADHIEGAIGGLVNIRTVACSISRVCRFPARSVGAGTIWAASLSRNTSAWSAIAGTWAMAKSA
jgi:hypothetical protein